MDMPEDLHQVQKTLSSMQRSVECRICLEVFSSPARTRCGHTFCSGCLQQLTRRPAPCPLCKTRLTRRSYSADPGAAALAAAVRSLVQAVQQDCGVNVSPSKYRPRPSVESVDAPAQPAEDLAVKKPASKNVRVAAEPRAGGRSHRRPPPRHVYGRCGDDDDLELLSASQVMEFDGERVGEALAAPVPPLLDAERRVSGRTRVQDWLGGATAAGFGITEIESPGVRKLDRVIAADRERLQQRLQEEKSRLVIEELEEPMPDEDKENRYVQEDGGNIGEAVESVPGDAAAVKQQHLGGKNPSPAQTGPKRFFKTRTTSEDTSRDQTETETQAMSSAADAGLDEDPYNFISSQRTPPKKKKARNAKRAKDKAVGKKLTVTKRRVVEETPTAAAAANFDDIAEEVPKNRRRAPRRRAAQEGVRKVTDAAAVLLGSGDLPLSQDSGADSDFAPPVRKRTRRAGKPAATAKPEVPPPPTPKLQLARASFGRASQEVREINQLFDNAAAEDGNAPATPTADVMTRERSVFLMSHVEKSGEAATPKSVTFDDNVDVREIPSMEKLTPVNDEPITEASHDEKKNMAQNSAKDDSRQINENQSGTTEQTPRPPDEQGVSTVVERRASVEDRDSVSDAVDTVTTPGPRSPGWSRLPRLKTSFGVKGSLAVCGGRRTPVKEPPTSDLTATGPRPAEPPVSPAANIDDPATTVSSDCDDPESDGFTASEGERSGRRVRTFQRALLQLETTVLAQETGEEEVCCRPAAAGAVPETEAEEGVCEADPPALQLGGGVESPAGAGDDGPPTLVPMPPRSPVPAAQTGAEPPRRRSGQRQGTPGQTAATDTVPPRRGSDQRQETPGQTAATDTVPPRRGSDQRQETLGQTAATDTVAPRRGSDQRQGTPGQTAATDTVPAPGLPALSQPEPSEAQYSEPQASQSVIPDSEPLRQRPPAPEDAPAAAAASRRRSSTPSVELQGAVSPRRHPPPRHLARRAPAHRSPLLRRLLRHLRRLRSGQRQLMTLLTSLVQQAAAVTSSLPEARSDLGAAAAPWCVSSDAAETAADRRPPAGPTPTSAPKSPGNAVRTTPSSSPRAAPRPQRSTRSRSGRGRQSTSSRSGSTSGGDRQSAGSKSKSSSGGGTEAVPPSQSSHPSSPVGFMTALMRQDPMPPGPTPAQTESEDIPPMSVTQWERVAGDMVTEAQVAPQSPPRGLCDVSTEEVDEYMDVMPLAGTADGGGSEEGDRAVGSSRRASLRSSVNPGSPAAVRREASPVSSPNQPSPAGSRRHASPAASAGRASLTSCVGGGSPASSVQPASPAPLAERASLENPASRASLGSPASRASLENPAGRTSLDNPAGRTSLDNPAGRTSLDNPARRASLENPAGRTSLDNPARRGSLENPASRAGQDNPASRASPANSTCSSNAAGAKSPVGPADRVSPAGSVKRPSPGARLTSSLTKSSRGSKKRRTEADASPTPEAAAEAGAGEEMESEDVPEDLGQMKGAIPEEPLDNGAENDNDNGAAVDEDLAEAVEEPVASASFNSSVCREPARRGLASRPVCISDDEDDEMPGARSRFSPQVALVEADQEFESDSDDQRELARIAAIPTEQFIRQLRGKEAEAEVTAEGRVEEDGEEVRETQNDVVDVETEVLNGDDSLVEIPEEEFHESCQVIDDPKNNQDMNESQREATEFQQNNPADESIRVVRKASRPRRSSAGSIRKDTPVSISKEPTPGVRSPRHVCVEKRSEDQGSGGGVHADGGAASPAGSPDSDLVVCSSAEAAVSEEKQRRLALLDTVLVTPAGRRRSLRPGRLSDSRRSAETTEGDSAAAVGADVTPRTSLPPGGVRRVSAASAALSTTCSEEASTPATVVSVRGDKVETPRRISREVPKSTETPRPGPAGDATNVPHPAAGPREPAVSPAASHVSRSGDVPAASAATEAGGSPRQESDLVPASPAEPARRQLSEVGAGVSEVASSQDLVIPAGFFNDSSLCVPADGLGPGAAESPAAPARQLVQPGPAAAEEGGEPEPVPSPAAALAAAPPAAEADASDAESEDLFGASRPIGRAAAGAAPPPPPPPPPPQLVLVASGLKRAEQEAARALAAAHGGLFLKQWSAEVTHVVVRTGDTLEAGRTLKFLQGVAARAWLVSHRWLEACLSADRLLPEAPYEAIDGATGEPGPQRARVSGGTIFSSFIFCCVEPFTDVTLQQLEELIRQCGGAVAPSPAEVALPSARPIRLVVAQEEDGGRHDFAGWRRRYGVPSVSYEWLIDCVATQRLWSLLDNTLCGASVGELLLAGVPETLCQSETQTETEFDSMGL